MIEKPCLIVTCLVYDLVFHTLQCATRKQLDRMKKMS